MRRRLDSVSLLSKSACFALICIILTFPINSSAQTTGGGGTPCACPPAPTRPVIIVTDNGGLGTGTVTWTCDNIYVLQEHVFVNAGDTLTINPGAIIKGAAGAGYQETNFTVGNITEQIITYTTYPGSLIISKGAVIIADGTPDCAITFTHEGDTFDGTVGVDIKGQWGGLIICGEGATNTLYYNNTGFPSQVTGLGTGTDLAEGVIDPTGNDRHAYGGNTAPAGSSGILRYVSLRHGSTSLGYYQNTSTNQSNNGNETNLLQLCAVGSGTQIDHVELVASADDGMQIMGGSVNVKYVGAAFNAEDGMEFDQGWNGKAQYLFVINDSSQVVGDSLGISNAIDMEGDDWEQSNVDISFMPYTNPTIINATYVGAKSQSGMRIHNGGATHMSNSLFLGFGQGMDFEDNDPCDAWEMFLFQEYSFKNNHFWDVGDSTSIMDMILYEGFLSYGQTAISGAFVTDSNLAMDPMLDYTVAVDATGMVVDPVFLEPGNGAVPALQFISPDPWFDPAMYYGAFEPGGINWLTCWSYMEQVGLFTVGGPTTIVSVPGCVYVNACNYNVDATIDDGSCVFDVCSGCTDVTACNFDALAQILDCSCIYPVIGRDCLGVCVSDIDLDNICDADEILGCQDPIACDYNSNATDSGVCDYTCLGCIYLHACNYDPLVSVDDGTCEFITCAGCTQPLSPNYDPTAVFDDGSCIFVGPPLCSEDINGDGLISSVDLITLLAAYGQTCVP